MWRSGGRCAELLDALAQRRRKAVDRGLGDWQELGGSGRRLRRRRREADGRRRNNGGGRGRCGRDERCELRLGRLCGHGRRGLGVACRCCKPQRSGSRRGSDGRGDGRVAEGRLHEARGQGEGRICRPGGVVVVLLRPDDVLGGRRLQRTRRRETEWRSRGTWQALPLPGTRLFDVRESRLVANAKVARRDRELVSLKHEGRLGDRGAVHLRPSCLGDVEQPDLQEEEEESPGKG